MMLSEYKFDGDIYVNEDIDLALDPELQTWSLVEDLIYVKYFNGLILDLGWSDEFNPNGCFVVSIIRDKDWESPVLRREIKYLEIINELNTLIKDFIK